jgi:acetoin utilization deacetylase AcuC-like enzyme
MTNTAFITDPAFLAHDTGPSHLERADRLRAILQRLDETGIRSRAMTLAPRKATRSMLELVHDPAYVDRVETDVRLRRPYLSTDPGMDTRLSDGTMDAALLAAGAVATAVDAVMSGAVRNAFCAVRPPGHHATRESGMGFCIFNNVAIGAQYARIRHGLQRVLIVDWDVHHGNGTEAIFSADPNVFFASSHQAGIYPGSGLQRYTGVGAGEGCTLNMPLPPFSSEALFLETWSQRLPARMEEFRPEIVFISAGFDAHKADLLGSLGMTAGGFGQITRLILSIARRYADGRVISVLEGGYNLEALADSVERHMHELLAAHDPGMISRG